MRSAHPVEHTPHHPLILLLTCVVWSPALPSPLTSILPNPHCPHSGEAAVTQGGKVVNRLFKADYFGEKALLSNEPRNASVSASQETVCLALDRDTFKEILGPYEQAMVVSTRGLCAVSSAWEASEAEGNAVAGSC